MGTYLLLPPRGFLDERMRRFSEAAGGGGGGGGIGSFSVGAVQGPAGADRTQTHDIEVLDSVALDGPKLVSMAPEHARQLRRCQDDFIVAPVRRYRQALRPLRRVRRKGLFDNATARTSVTIWIVEKHTGRPVEGATVVATIDKDRNLGITRRTGSTGRITLTFPGTSTRVAELIVSPRFGAWGVYRRNIVLSDGDKIELDPIDLGKPDFLQTVYGQAAGDAGQGVRVAVVDSGVDTKHPCLTVHGGENFASDGPSNDYGAGADGHGTHVAGIIAGHGQLGTGMRGVAPAAEIYSYRVFPKNGGSADTTVIMKSIYKAVEDGCHLVNLSLGGGQTDPALNQAIGHAYNNGVVCVAAAGNEYRAPVSYPAWYKRALGVSALGSKRHFPDGAKEWDDVEAPASTEDSNRFIASFSNIGEEIDFTGPGVGIVSCFPVNRYAVMSGTSMATPAVVGVAARLLGERRDLRDMDGNLTKARRIVDMLREQANTAGFTPVFEGFGLVQSTLTTDETAR